MSLDAGDVLHGVEPTIPEPAEWTARDRELWDALVFNAFDDWQSAPEQVTLAITPARLASINICQQGPDVSDVGGVMEPYGRAWWREAIRYWSGLSWAGDYVPRRLRRRARVRLAPHTRRRNAVYRPRQHAARQSVGGRDS